MSNQFTARSISTFNRELAMSLNKRGYLVSKVAVMGTYWVAYVRGTGWVLVNDLLKGEVILAPFPLHMAQDI